jgi:hypothetical protein
MQSFADKRQSSERLVRPRGIINESGVVGVASVEA